MIRTTPHRRPHQQGLSYLEMAIVIVIAGLIAGTVMVARDLKQTAKLEALTADLVGYEAAINQFHKQYNALPGDIKNATYLWGKAGGNGDDAACQDTLASGRPTCNGNGDGIIATSVTPLDESFRAWQHLHDATLVAGEFTGSITGIPFAKRLGRAFPTTKDRTIGYQLITEDKTSEGWAHAPEGTALIPAIRIAAPINEDAALTGNVLSPASAYLIDQKIDDAKPGTGKIYAVLTGSDHCTDSNETTSANYLAKNHQVGCFLQYSLLK